MFGPKGPFCQSCAMPFATRHGGSEADGHTSGFYCSHCYRRGQFTNPDLTADDMMELVEARLRSLGFPGFWVRQFTRRIPALKRWREAAQTAAA